MDKLKKKTFMQWKIVLSKIDILLNINVLLETVYISTS